jgi:acyl-CoA thioester hydrolase
MARSGYLWPIIECHVRYIRPARFGSRLAVTASLVEWRGRLAIHYLVADEATRVRVARARTVQVAVCRDSNELQFASPEEFLRRVEAGIAAARS